MEEARSRVPWFERLVAVPLATGLGVGLIPFAPGTAGTLLGLPLGWWLCGRGGGAVLLGAALISFLGVWAGGVCSRLYSRRDPPAVVIDEVAGFLVAVAGIPPHWPWLLGAFALFRIADILKPWPAGFIDRKVPGGLGIVLDDIVAGLYARGALEVILRISG